MKKLVFLILLLLSTPFVIGQTVDQEDSRLQSSKTFAKDTLVIDAYLNEAEKYPITTVDAAQVVFNKAIKAALDLKSQQQLAKVFYRNGLYYRNNFKYFEAIKKFNKALPFFKDSKSLSDINFYLGECYLFVYSDDIAFKYYLRALNLYKKDNNEKGIAYCYDGIGTIYSDKNYKVAIDYFNKALAIFKKHKEYSGISSCYINLANVVADHESIEKGLVLYNKSLVTLKQEKDNYNLAINYNNIGDCYIELEQYETAMSYFDKALLLSNAIDGSDINAFVYLNIAEVKFKQKRYKEAIIYAQKSLGEAKAFGDMEIQSESILILSNTYEKSKKLTQALQYKNEYIAIRERILDNSNQKKMQVFQSITELEKSQFEINELTIKNENAALKLESKKDLSYFLFFISLILILFVVVLFIQQKAKHRVYDLLKIKSDQVSKMKDDIQVQNDHLNDLNNTKNKLFKIIAHDLKNPLSSIEGFTDLMLQNNKEEADNEQTVFLNVIKDSATKASSILNDVLVWAIDQDNGVKIKNLSIHQLINDELKLLEVQALQKEIQINNQVDDRLNVVTDKNKLATIIRNLISNAIKFSYSKGSIQIKSELKNDVVEIAVIDQGKGMTAEEMSTLFTVDYKKSKVGTNNESGMGLGLVLCKDFVEKLGGKITVSSVLNQGSAFVFTLPLSSVA